MIRGRDINTVVNHCKSTLDMQLFTQTGRRISKVITKHLCHYRNSSYKYMWFYRVILTTVFLRIFRFKTSTFLEISKPLYCWKHAVWVITTYPQC